MPCLRWYRKVHAAGQSEPREMYNNSLADANHLAWEDQMRVGDLRVELQ